MQNPKINFFRAVYLFIAGCLMAIVVLTPYLVENGIFFIREDVLEGIIIAFFLFAQFILGLIYERQMKKWRKNLEEAWKHIGRSNILIDRFKTALVYVKKYPESKKDIKYIFEIMAEKIFGIADSRFVIFRVVDVKRMKTLSEYFQGRGDEKSAKVKISNKELIKGRNDELEIIFSRADNNIKTFCVFPKTPLNEEQKIFLNKIVEDFTMLYVIFSFYASQK